MSSTKQKSLFFLTAAVILTLILAMSLPNLVLQPGQSFSLERSSLEAPVGIGSLPATDMIMQVFRGLLALAIILLPVHILYSLLTAEGRRRMLGHLVMIVLLLLVVDYLRNLPQEEAEPEEQLMEGVPNWGEFGEGGTPVIFSADPPQEFTLVVILLVSILLVVITAGGIWYWRQRQKPLHFAFDELAEEAQNAITSIQAGGDFEMTIIHCYQEMSRVLKEEKGITRKNFMTPREFEDGLIQRGLPQESLRTLTRLFEQARYSSTPAGTHEQTVAVACLTDIVNACRMLGGDYGRA